MIMIIVIRIMIVQVFASLLNIPWLFCHDTRNLFHSVLSTGADMRSLVLLSVCLATLYQTQGLCPVSKTVGGICYTRLNNSVETSQYGCQEPCIYTTREGRTFCFKTGEQAVTENCSSLRHTWTCEHCRRTGRDLAGILTTDDGLAEIGGMLVTSLCPLAPDRQECETSLPGFWGAIARIIFPQFGEEYVCDMETCQEGEEEVR